MQEKKIEALTKPFHEKLIKQKPPQGLDYVEAGYYVHRLNKAFEHKWNLEVLDTQIQEISTKKGQKQYVIVKVRLTAGEIIKESFGGHLIATQEIADAYKAAVTDAMKKCAWMMGIGVSNWLDSDEDLFDLKVKRSELISRTAEILEGAGLVGDDTKIMRSDLFKKYFGTNSKAYIFNTLPIDELEKGIDELEKDLEAAK